MTRPPASLDFVCPDFDAALDLLRGAGLRLDVIYPADRPHTAVLSHDGRTVRLSSEPGAPVPGGRAEFRPELLVTHAGETAGEGRAGMLYSDLIPGRLGGRYIASRITIPDGGEVADWVHFHKVDFQMIYLRRGWVTVVYEDQGEPFRLHPGDLVLQPPGIRHRVLESSPGLEVIEVGRPALHETFADHDLALPNGREANRSFAGQHFLRHVAADAPWTPFHGGESQETAMAEATGGLAEARTLRPGAEPKMELPAHDGELVFGFVLEGTAELECGQLHHLGPADAFVIPPGEPWSLGQAADDLRLLHVTTRKIA